MSSKKHSILFIVVAVAALLVFTSVAYAAHVTIDTNDGAVDTNWSAVPMLYDDGGDGVADNYNIAEAWMGNNASPPTEFYFRVNLWNSGLLPVNSSLEAALDCNQNGLFDEVVDVTVAYQLLSGGLELVVECQGDLSACDTDGSPTALGEEITGTPNNYEWMANTSGTVDWSNCLGAVDVQFRSWDLNSPSVTPQDETAVRGYSVPNVVTLKSFTAQNRVLPAAAIVLGVVAVGGLVVIRRRKGQ
jgi:hypothetical protein